MSTFIAALESDPGTAYALQVGRASLCRLAEALDLIIPIAVVAFGAGLLVPRF